MTAASPSGEWGDQRLPAPKVNIARDRPCAVVGIGELLWDLLPDGPRLGGAPFNVVAHLRRLGCRATYVSAVGRDELGRRAIAEVEQLGVSTSLLQVNDRPTGVVRVTLDGHGAPEYEIYSPAAYESIEVPEGRDLVLGDVDLMVFGTLAQRFVGVRAATRRLVDASPDALRLYDINLRPGCWDLALVRDLLHVATVVKLNEAEQTAIADGLGLPASPIQSFVSAACDRFALRAVCVTRGAAGAAMRFDGVYLEAPAPPVDVVDTVGAGDAFGAALLFGIRQGWPAAEILSVANRLGAFVASRPGAIPAWDPRDLGVAGPRPT